MDDFLEVVIGPQRVRLYIIPGVKEDTVFAPQTKKEISEISWHRLDDLQPASEEAISRAVNGLKLYMVAPFLAALKAWIAAHPLPGGQKADTSTKGISVWKAKSGSGSGSGPAPGPISGPSSGPGSTSDNQLQRVASDHHSADVGPGRSFRNFRFDVPSIMQSMEAAFAAAK